jgi:hypothetical protein
MNADLAKELSQCPSKTSGGRIGWVLPGMADSAIGAAVLDKPVGSVTLAKSSAGHHLIEILNESTSSQESASFPLAAEAGIGANSMGRGRVFNASVQQLADVMRDPEKVSKPPPSYV